MNTSRIPTIEVPEVSPEVPVEIKNNTRKWEKNGVIRHYFTAGYLKKANAYYAENGGKAKYEYPCGAGKVYAEKCYNGAIKDEIKELIPEVPAAPEVSEVSPEVPEVPEVPDMFEKLFNDFFGYDGKGNRCGNMIQKAMENGFSIDYENNWFNKIQMDETGYKKSAKKMGWMMKKMEYPEEVGVPGHFYKFFHKIGRRKF